MSKILKYHGVAYRRFKKQQGGKFDGTCGKGCVYAYAKKTKNRKLMMRKVATSRKSKNHNRQSKTRHISVC